MNLSHILAKQASDLHDTPALIEKGQTLTFSELEDRVARASAFLTQQGLKMGDPVLVFQPISIELYVILLAIFRLGLVAVFIDTQSGLKHIENCCRRYPPKAFIATTKAHVLRLVSRSLRAIPLKIVVGFPAPAAIRWSSYCSCEPLARVASMQKDSPALVTFTSGSTGMPKAAVRTHGFLLAQHKVLADSLRLRAGQVDVITLPIFVLANLASGVTSLIPNADLRKPGFIDARQVIQQIEQYHANRCAASPAFFERLLDHCEAVGKQMDSFEEVYTGGAPVFPRLLDRLAKFSPNAEVVAVYGSTEAEPIAHIARHELTPEDQQAMLNGKGLPAGLPVSEIQLRIIPDQWDEPIGPFSAEQFDSLQQNAHKTGEIVVRGEHVLQGYLEGVGDRENKFEVDGNRWHRTGDAGYLDDQGRLWLMGRCGAKVEDNSAVIYPFAVEVAAMQYAAIRRAAFIKIKNRKLLAVERNKGHEIQQSVLMQALEWAEIDKVIFVTSMPVDKRHNAKIDYAELHRQLHNK
ncbi:MAG: AMP-binding protein [Gammaproteobacteria bacterium]|nr:AMP-binding protein [Gammaproteobacteria bacterium]